MIVVKGIIEEFYQIDLIESYSTDSILDYIEEYKILKEIISNIMYSPIIDKKCKDLSDKFYKKLMLKVIEDEMSGKIYIGTKTTNPFIEEGEYSKVNIDGVDYFILKAKPEHCNLNTFKVSNKRINLVSNGWIELIMEYFDTEFIDA